MHDSRLEETLAESAPTETPRFAFDRQKVKQLRIAFTNAVQQHNTQFTFEGHVLLMPCYGDEHRYQAKRFVIISASNSG